MKHFSATLAILFMALNISGCKKEEIQNCEGDNVQHIDFSYLDEFKNTPCALQNINTEGQVVNLIIKTLSDYEKYITCSSQRPVIDFEKYLILAGRYRHHQCAVLDNQQVQICNNKLIYKVTMLEHDCQAITDVFYITAIEREYENIPIVFDVKLKN
jgi:hypothetical protein